jgi:hypothetical protein
VCWASTWNNISFSRELNRRIVPIELIAESENPSLRTGFKYNPILEEFVEPRRIDLMRACLTICQHWIVEGCPKGSQVMGRFESYARTMGGILDSIGVEGFMANRPKLIDRNVESSRWGALVAAWHGARGQGLVGTGDIWGIITAEGNEELAVTFSDLIGDGGVLSQKQRLGKDLEKQTNQVWGDWRITRSTATSRNKSALYKLKSASEPYTDTDDSDPPPSDTNGYGDY